MIMETLVIIQPERGGLGGKRLLLFDDYLVINIFFILVFFFSFALTTLTVLTLIKFPAHSFPQRLDRIIYLTHNWT